MSFTRLSYRKPLRFGCVLALAAVLTAGFAQAQETNGDNLAQAANDPTAALMSFQLQDSYSPSIYGTDGASLNSLQFRAAIPFEFAGLQNIFRVTLPYITNTPSGATGLSDMVLFDLVTFDRSWGRFGVGAVALVPTGSDGLSAEKWGVGPAAGFTAKSGKVLWGAFNQNIFSFAGDDDMPDVNVSILQPILSVGLGDGWSTGVSEMSVTYDWDKDDWTSLPLGVKLAKLHRFGTTPVQFTAQYEHNFADDQTVPEDLYSFTVKVLMPKG
jgi:hypothetical protein